jgi:hypothetical protein
MYINCIVCCSNIHVSIYKHCNVYRHLFETVFDDNTLLKWILDPDLSADATGSTHISVHSVFSLVTHLFF